MSEMQMKSGSEFEAKRDTAYRVVAAELRQFVERFERLEAEKLGLVELQKELMAEAKARGYETKALRAIIRERKRDRSELAEEQAIIDLYREALGM